MTKEEITICKMYLNDLDKTHDCNEYKLLMQLLEQQPCEDSISRKELKKWLDINFSFGGALRKLELFDRLDKELPSVTPKGVTVTDFADKCRECGKMKKGKWVDKEKITFPICSKCGLTSVEKYSFCPNCGAEMEDEI